MFQNVVKPAFFARDLIISAGDGKENKQEYNELLDSFIIFKDSRMTKKTE